MGGATLVWKHWREFCGISIHAPRGGSDPAVEQPVVQEKDFNPRSPWGERLGFSIIVTKVVVFQSTLPVGGATRWSPPPAGAAPISIHAPRGGSDFGEENGKLYASDFNPRSPWGERQKGCSHWSRRLQFQSTLPVGGATDHYDKEPTLSDISIHAPRGGSDSKDAQIFL